MFFHMADIFGRQLSNEKNYWRINNVTAFKPGVFLQICQDGGDMVSCSYLPLRKRMHLKLVLRTYLSAFSTLLLVDGGRGYRRIWPAQGYY